MDVSITPHRVVLRRKYQEDKVFKFWGRDEADALVHALNDPDVASEFNDCSEFDTDVIPLNAPQLRCPTFEAPEPRSLLRSLRLLFS